MVKHYSDQFKREALTHLLRLDRGYKTYIDGLEILNVRELCISLGISSYSLYQWKKSIDISENEINNESNVNRISDNEEPPSLALIDNTDLLIVNDKLTINSEIRFFGFIASVLNIKGYNSMPLAQLKFKIGLKLLRDCNLVERKRFDFLKELD